MKVEIEKDGCLVITAESNVECYALEQWRKNCAHNGLVPTDLIFDFNLNNQGELEYTLDNVAEIPKR